MKIKILGFKNVDFVSNNGQRVIGCRIWYSFTPTDDKVNGLQTDSYYFNSTSGIGSPVPNSFVVGNEYTLEFAVYGSGDKKKTNVTDVIDLKTGKSLKMIKSVNNSNSSNNFYSS